MQSLASDDVLKFCNKMTLMYVSRIYFSIYLKFGYLNGCQMFNAAYLGSDLFFIYLINEMGIVDRVLTHQKFMA